MQLRQDNTRFTRSPRVTVPEVNATRGVIMEHVKNISSAMFNVDRVEASEWEA
jgi:hypothetical protein